MDFRILELFSGIGGMHEAFKYAALKGEVVAAVEINPVANETYKLNHPNTNIWNKNIEKLNVEAVKKLNVNLILMSPPCQPHTRVGNKRDVNDRRSNALTHIITLLPECNTVQYVLLENVKGFEKSQAREQYISALEAAGFFWREFIISPHQLGVPNTRHRYYCLARRTHDFDFPGNQLWTHLPFSNENTIKPTQVKDILEEVENVADYRVPCKVLQKYGTVFDIVTAACKNTNCFTKAYTHYHEGTGSVYASNAEKLKDFKDLKVEKDAHEKQFLLLKQLDLRFFTPREVSRLMSFPETFEFPANCNLRQKYKLLGNSINIKVVGELIKLLCS